uniref:Uncharacterized protein n=1 Tax=Mucochytrium quahogii TaxID=96639 RepID=A0A7S2RLV0_9STRA|mmetsp:Transcript_18434/g.30003  ORF Transcript_18434/g.30003 Transcript_18434/m.30003 type:complete len:821 (+) Transcript_18434:210-2672(+)
MGVPVSPDMERSVGGYGCKMATEETLKVLVENYLGLYLHRNAMFLAERLYVLNKTQQNLYLLATCYTRAGMFHRAYKVLQKDMDMFSNSEDDEDLKDVHTQIRYLLAQCCLKLGYYREAEAALLHGTSLAIHGPQKCVQQILNGSDVVANGAAGLYLLGMICSRDNRRDQAITYFSLALKLDPFCWDAYEQLCGLGVDIPPSCFFGLKPTELSASEDKNDSFDDENGENDAPPKLPLFLSEGEPMPAPVPVPVKVPLPSSKYERIRYISGFTVNNADDSGPLRSKAQRGGGDGGDSTIIPIGYNIRSMERFGWATPTPVALANAEVLAVDSIRQVKGAFVDVDPSTQALLDPPTPPAMGTRKNPRRNTRRSASRDNGGDENQLQETASIRRSTRHSNRVQNTSDSASSEDKMDIAKCASGIVNIDSENQYTSQNMMVDGSMKKADSQDETPRPHRPRNSRRRDPGIGNRGSPTPDGQECNVDFVLGSLKVLELLCILGEGVLLLSQYCCSEAIESFSTLPPEQLETGWVQQQKGKACFEMADYRGATEAFEKMRRYAPDRTAGLEVYSTNLWHLKEEVQLCYLAQEALALDKRSPESWCAIGNCFSLQKEHDVAIKFFQRALQIDPSFTYAYTLSGHEYVSNEDFEKAVACYRHAIRTDSRHYNAWYGLGTIYYRQEKYDLAEYHFRRAISINPRSSVLYCYLGMVLHASQKCEEALNMLQRASALEPSNPQAKFQRALVLRTMECYEAALEELEAVRNFAPRESSVHFLMGKICKQLDKKDEAMLHFTTALDLDPKDSNLIKLAIDKLDTPDMDETDDL